MELGFCVLIRITLIVVSIQEITCQQCGSKKEVSYAHIPKVDSLLSLTEFDSHIVDNQMSEMYFALPRPAAFQPDINYKSTITKDAGSSNYIQNTIGETLATNPTCASGSVPLTPVYGINKALFFRDNSQTVVQAMWSSCPTKYVVNMRCSNYKLGQRKCLLKDTVFGVYIHGNMKDAPISEIIEDLCRVTGVKFGSPSFEWYFSYGENTLC